MYENDVGSMAQILVKVMRKLTDKNGRIWAICFKSQKRH